MLDKERLLSVCVYLRRTSVCLQAFPSQEISECYMSVHARTRAHIYTHKHKGPNTCTYTYADIYMHTYIKQKVMPLCPSPVTHTLERKLRALIATVNRVKNAMPRILQLTLSPCPSVSQKQYSYFPITKAYLPLTTLELTEAWELSKKKKNQY